MPWLIVGAIVIFIVIKMMSGNSQENASTNRTLKMFEKYGSDKCVRIADFANEMSNKAMNAENQLKAGVIDQDKYDNIMKNLALGHSRFLSKNKISSEDFYQVIGLSDNTR